MHGCKGTSLTIYHARKKINIRYFFILFQPTKQGRSRLLSSFLIVMYLVHCFTLWTITLSNHTCTALHAGRPAGRLLLLLLPAHHQSAMSTQLNQPLLKLTLHEKVYLIISEKRTRTYLFRHFAVWWNKLWTQDNTTFFLQDKISTP